MRLSHVAWNAAGLAAPLLFALLCVPPLLRLLGTERFGLLALAWALTALSGLFDLGIGRAVTQRIAAQLGHDRSDLASATMALAQRVALLTGAVGTLVLLAATAAGAYRSIRVGPGLDDELRLACVVLAFIVPLQTLVATYRGVAEACQRFRGISLVRMALGVANFVAPWAVAQYTMHMGALVFALLLARLAAVLAYRHLAHDAVPAAAVGSPMLPAIERRALLSAGGWFTVSAVVSPLLVQADRFFIGAQISASAVSAYAIPFDIVTQLLVVVTAVSTVAFPTISRQLQVDPSAARRQFGRWLVGVCAAVGVVAGLMGAWLPELLNAWIGADVPSASAEVGRWLCLGVWINAIGSMFLAWLHAQGRFRATAMLHLIELPIYIALLVALLGMFGVVGAAMAWAARVTLDSVALGALAMTSRGPEAAA